jgi:hypothetical protein
VLITNTTAGAAAITETGIVINPQEFKHTDSTDMNIETTDATTAADLIARTAGVTTAERPSLGA